jgi:hypothetical protein
VHTTPHPVWFQFLVGRAGRLDGVMQLTLGGVQQLLGLLAMTGHVVVVGGTGAIHFLNRFPHVLVHFVQIMPVPHRLGVSRDTDEHSGTQQSKRYFLHKDLQAV